MLKRQCFYDSKQLNTLLFSINSVSVNASLTFAKKQGIMESFGLVSSLEMIAVRKLRKVKKNLGKLSSSFIVVSLEKSLTEPLIELKQLY